MTKILFAALLGFLAGAWFERTIVFYACDNWKSFTFGETTYSCQQGQRP
jgi:hypothetical protein